LEKPPVHRDRLVTGQLGMIEQTSGSSLKCIGERFLMVHSLLNAQEATEILRMDTRTIIRWARLGYLPAHPLGEGKRKIWRFLEHELLQWVEARESDRNGSSASTISAAISAHARRTA
jgi:Helix-turn-helix domain